MPKHIRAKFVVESASDIKERQAAEGWSEPNSPNYGKWEVRKVRERVDLKPVYASGAPDAENVSFAKSTPNGAFWMAIDNPEAWGLIVPGDKFYIDLTLAPRDCTACHGQGRRTYPAPEPGKPSPYADCDRCAASGIDPEQPAD